MINCKNLWKNFLKTSKSNLELAPSIAFQLLALEPFTEDCFTDSQTSTLIHYAMMLDEDQKVLIASEAYQKADDTWQPLENQIYYLLICICCCFYLQGILECQRNEDKINYLLKMAQKYNSYTINTFSKTPYATEYNSEHRILTY